MNKESDSKTVEETEDSRTEAKCLSDPLPEKLQDTVVSVTHVAISRS